MLRIKEICVKKDEKSRIAFSQIQQCIEDVMKKNASSVNFKVKEENGQLNVNLETEISIQTANKFLIAFDKKRMRLMKFCLERKMLGDVFPIGHLEIIVS